MCACVLCVHVHVLVCCRQSVLEFTDLGHLQRLLACLPKGTFTFVAVANTTYFLLPPFKESNFQMCTQVPTSHCFLEQLHSTRTSTLNVVDSGVVPLVILYNLYYQRISLVDYWCHFPVCVSACVRVCARMCVCVCVYEDMKRKIHFPIEVLQSVCSYNSLSTNVPVPTGILFPSRNSLIV